MLLDARPNPRSGVPDQVARRKDTALSSQTHGPSIEQDGRVSYYDVPALVAHDGLRTRLYRHFETDPRSVPQQLCHARGTALHDLLKEHRIGSKGDYLGHPTSKVDHFGVGHVARQGLLEVCAEDENLPRRRTSQAALPLQALGDRQANRGPHRSLADSWVLSLGGCVSKLITRLR